MALERELLEPIASMPPICVIDTSRMGVHELREIIHQRVEQRSAGRLSITFESFGFKHGIPGDADFVFDARALPNPYWEPGLRNLTGRDPEVIRFLETHTHVEALIADIATFVAGASRNTRQATAATSRSPSAAPAASTARCYIVDRLAENFAARIRRRDGAAQRPARSEAVPAAAARRGCAKRRAARRCRRRLRSPARPRVRSSPAAASRRS